MSSAELDTQRALAEPDNKPPRVLIITDQTNFARALEHHVSIIWSDAECRIHSPRHSGGFHPAFSATAFDAVLLDDRVEGGPSGEWLKALVSRKGFPSIVYFGSGEDPEVRPRALAAGAFECLARERVDNQKLATALIKARDQRRRMAAADKSTQKFGQLTIPGYRFVQELAASASSLVYLAESERAGEMVVLKILREEFDPQSVEYGRFLREYDLLSKIRDANVVRILDLGVSAAHAYIAMEYFPGGDLRARISRGMTPPQALGAVSQMAHALEVVHEVGVLHRDLKPGNVMVRADGSFALIDFGLAKQSALETGDTAAGHIFGTPYYMSPEQGHGRELDARSDLYSLGVMFYEMLTGKKPFVAPKPMTVLYMHANAPRPELAPEMSAYQSLLDRLIAADPDQRYGSASELLTALHMFRELEA